jgi:hypothetical protein
MKNPAVYLLTLMLVVIAGCSTGSGAGGTPEAQTLDAATNFAQAIRLNALSVRNALQEQDAGIEGAKRRTESLLEALDGYESNSDAEPHKAIYADLAKLGQELTQMFEASAPLPEIQKKINELAGAAEKLPGADIAPILPQTNDT